MKKNITSILQRGNIKPSDRVKLLVADMASKERDGKTLLTEADKHALSEGWTPKNNEEVREYNRFNEGWKNVAYAEMDAQTTYLQATNNFLMTQRAISFFVREKKGNSFMALAKHFNKDFKEGDALNLVLGYLGLELDYTIYLYAFELAGEQLQKDLLALYPDAKTERSYLEQEEIIYNLFNGKDKLSQTDKEKLAELIADECFNKYIGEWSFDGYYADIPLIEIVRKWADNNKINYEVSDKDLVEAEQKQKQAKDANSLIAGDKSLDTPEGKELRKEKLTAKILPEKLTAYAKENKREIKDIITETILKWLDEDLMDEYAPLFKSDKKETCNEQDTKLTHKELFKKWLNVKEKATETIQGLIDKGELKTAKRTKDFSLLKNTILNAFDIDDELKEQKKKITETKTIITGESLYNLKGKYQFIKDFREQAEDLKFLGALVLFLRECSFVKDYSTLLAFELLFKELSKTFETDLTYSIKKWIRGFKEEFGLFKIEFLRLADDITKNSDKDKVFFQSETSTEELLTMPFDPDKIKPDMDGRIKVYAGKIKDILQDDFKNPFDYEK